VLYYIANNMMVFRGK